MQQINPHILAIDLGGHNLRTALVNKHAELIEPTRIRTDVSREPEPVIAQICQEVTRITDKHPDKNIIGMGIGVPGFVACESGIVYASPNFPTWKDTPIKQELEQRLPFPVIIDNDANAAALGEYWCGKGKGAKTFALLTLGTGVGSGIIIDGKIFKGSRGAAAELGHIKIRKDGSLCGCGGRGCLETWVSGSALESETGTKAKDLYQQAVNGDPKALEIWFEMGQRLGTALSNMAFTLDPDIIAIGGRVSQAFEFFFPGIEQVFGHNLAKHPARQTSIVLSTCWNDGGLLGMAKLGFDHFLLD